MKLTRIGTALALAALAGCSFAPTYHVPKLDVPDAPYKETAGWKPATPTDDLPKGEWWKVFHDADLDALEAKLGSDNQNLKIALARFEEARALSSAARADYFPQVTGNASAIRAQESKTVAVPSSKTLFNDYTLGADFSYELDLWGKVRNAVAAAENRAEASKADLAAVELSLRAELASDYFILRGYDSEQVILDQTIANYAQAFDLTRARMRGGIAPETDVDQAETQLQNARTQATDTRLKRAQLEHAIAVLTGQPPSAFSLPARTLTATPPALSAGLPATLLLRRPDIAAAERRAAAANADIGVARAAWFPDISLTGTFGFESASTASFLTMPSHFWTLGPQLATTLFDAGRISALSQEARAAYDEAAATYRQSALTGYQEVEDSLVALHRLSEENESQSAATAAAGRVLEQEQARYHGGIDPYLNVVTAQNTALQAQLASVDILTRRVTASVQLIKALGGGWQTEGVQGK